MADHKRSRGEPDRSRISLSQEYEIRYWTEELGVSEAELRQAIGAAGNMPTAVRRFLGR